MPRGDLYQNAAYKAEFQVAAGVPRRPAHLSEIYSVAAPAFWTRVLCRRNGASSIFGTSRLLTGCGHDLIMPAGLTTPRSTAPLILYSRGEGMQAPAQNLRYGGTEPDGAKISTLIPARLDRLPWSRFHLLILFGLGITWILDGIEVTIVGAIAPVLRDRETLGLSAAQIGSAASSYVAGAVIGALMFGWLTDRFGRRLVFTLRS